MGGAATKPVGLRFDVVMGMGAALGADAELLARVLPGVEVAILRGGDDGADVDDVGDG